MKSDKFNYDEDWLESKICILITSIRTKTQPNEPQPIENRHPNDCKSSSYVSIHIDYRYLNYGASAFNI